MFCQPFLMKKIIKNKNDAKSTVFIGFYADCYLELISEVSDEPSSVEPISDIIELILEEILLSVEDTSSLEQPANTNAVIITARSVNTIREINFDFIFFTPEYYLQRSDKIFKSVFIKKFIDGKCRFLIYSLYRFKLGEFGIFYCGQALEILHKG